MLKRRVIPCLDVAHGRVVKGVRFQQLRDLGDPVDFARRYQREGADELVVLDIAATLEQRDHHLAVIRRIRSILEIPLTVGGGIRSVEDAEALLTAGADKIAVNTAAVRRPELLQELAQEFGRQCVVLSIDVEPNETAWIVRDTAGTQKTSLDAVSWIVEATERGAGELLLTSYDRDGTGDGYDLSLLQTIRTVTSRPIIASGGASNPTHLVDALRVGADAVLAASMFHERRFSIGDVKQAMQHTLWEIRL